MRKLTIFATLICAIFLPAGAWAADKGVSATVLIKAPAAAVWDSIGDTKHFDSKIDRRNPNEATVEQKFHVIPMLGETTAVIKVTAVPKQRIDYKLIKSDKLKDLSGSWTLTEISPTTTKLQLSSRVDLGLPVPHFLVNRFVAQKVRVRLQKVKKLAEANASTAGKTADASHITDAASK